MKIHTTTIGLLLSVAGCLLSPSILRAEDAAESRNSVQVNRERLGLHPMDPRLPTSSWVAVKPPAPAPTSAEACVVEITESWDHYADGSTRMYLVLSCQIEDKPPITITLDKHDEIGRIEQGDTIQLIDYVKGALFVTLEHQGQQTLALITPDKLPLNGNADCKANVELREAHDSTYIHFADNGIQNENLEFTFQHNRIFGPYSGFPMNSYQIQVK